MRLRFVLVHIRSKMPAAPCPPPTHMLTSPYRPWRRFQFVEELGGQLRTGAAERMTGAIAPPLTFSRSGSSGSSANRPAPAPRGFVQFDGIDLIGVSQPASALCEWRAPDQ